MLRNPPERKARKRYKQAFMKQFTFSILLFLSLSSYGQKSIDTIKGRFDNTTSWYKENKKWDDKMGLANLLTTKDSLCIRFRDGKSIVDIVINKQGQVKANNYSYLFKLDKKHKPLNVIYKKLPIDKELALHFLDTLYKLGIPDFYDGYKIPKYPITVDGVVYDFVFSTCNSYKNILFANPSEALDLKEGRTVYEFVKYIDKLFGLENNFNNLKLTLTKGTYRIAGMWIYRVRQW